MLAPGATGYSGARDLRGMYEQPLLTLMAIVMLLLLIASVNVANLFIARGIAMRHQLSVRLALGASRGRLVRQLLTECALLYGAGAVLGLGIAAWTSRLLVRQLSTPPADSVVLDLSTDGRVLAFTIAITVVTTLLFGTAPAFRASRVAPMAALKPQGHAIVAEGRNALTGWLMIGQVALSLVLVVGAGLFVRTLVSLAGRELGFDPSRVLLVNVDAHNATKDAAQRLALYERARDAVRLLPDAAEAALSLTTPVGSGQFTPPVDIDGVSDTQGPVWANLVSPGWFATYRIPLLAGRDLGDRDHAGTPRVVVVNEAFVRKFAGGENPIGRTMTLYPRTRLAMGPIQIVGVVGDAVYSSLRSSAPPTFYLPLAQFDYLTELGIRSINLSVRSRTESPAALTKSVTAAVGSVDPKLALTFRLLANQVRAAQTQERMTALLSSFFAALALLLAALGLYGVTSYSVGTRRTEIGIRMALGSSTGSAVRLILRRVAFLLSVGIAIGLVGSVWASRFVAALLYGVQPRDLSTLLGAIALLAAVGLLGAYLPARRAALVDPMVALRAE